MFDLAFGCFRLLLLPGTALAHDHKDSEPDDVGQARQWIEQGLDHFKDVKITDQYISFSDRQQQWRWPACGESAAPSAVAARSETTIETACPSGRQIIALSEKHGRPRSPRSFV